MTAKKQEEEKKESLVSKFKDWITIILFLVTVLGWITTYTSNKASNKAALDNNTKAVEKLNVQMEKMNEYIKTQSELNGKFIQYMEMDSKK